MDSVRHLESGRKITLSGMNSSHRIIIEKERQVWINTLNLRTNLLRQEERETKEGLRNYLMHLRKMKDIKL